MTLYLLTPPVAEPPYRIDEGRTTYCALDARVPVAFTVDAFSVSVCRESE